MKRLTREQQKTIVLQWKRAAPALARAREEELASWRYDGSTVDALLDIGAKSPRKEEEPNGLVEMQRLFIKAARQQGLLPPLVREAPAAYGKTTLRARSPRKRRRAKDRSESRHERDRLEADSQAEDRR